eukprot:COSAG02_NODE_33907_length_492_cov_1.170483_1_plen_59_part_01
MSVAAANGGAAVAGDRGPAGGGAWNVCAPRTVPRSRHRIVQRRDCSYTAALMRNEFALL